MFYLWYVLFDVAVWSISNVMQINDLVSSFLETRLHLRSTNFSIKFEIIDIKLMDMYIKGSVVSFHGF